MHISKLILWKRNYRKGDIDAITRSITQFGFNQALRVWRDNVVIAGNHSLKALQALKASGWTPRGGGLTDDWQVRIIDVSHLTETEAQAFAVADNHTNELAQNDPEQLATLLQELQASDEALFAATGYGAGELSALLDSLQSNYPTETPEAKINKADEMQEKWQVERGQIWQVGNHRVMCGDSTSAEDVARLMDRATADLLHTDPPYGIQMDKGFGGSGGFNGNGKSIARRQYDNKWDQDRPTIATFDLLLPLAKKAIIWGGNFFADLLPKSTHWIVWDKLNTMPSFGDCELAWTSFDRISVKKITHEYNGLIGKEKERFHATQKPAGLFMSVLQEYSEFEMIILDPFLGSGTSLVACEQTGRIGYGMELHPPYVAVTLERLTDMGLKARCING